VGQDQVLGWGRSRSREVLGEALALVKVKQCKAFQKGDRFWLVSGLACSRLFVLRHEAVGVDHRRPDLAAADVTS
jgi:hypothetical protein